ncbi:unnamed protein product [Pylaiella littoralis]
MEGSSEKKEVGEDVGRMESKKVEKTTPVAVEHECPYAIYSEEEAILRIENTSLPGNIVTVKNLRWCRLGNHFVTVVWNMALGYCCKSKMVWMPPKDDVLAPGVFNEGTPGPRWFDFSSSPGMPGFDSNSCPTNITWGGRSAARMDELETQGHELRTRGLKRCIRQAPRLLGCEAAYYFPMDVELCPSAAASSSKLVEATPSNEQEGQVELTWGGREGGGEGTLVIHVRSGDAFGEHPLSSYGQPPLQFYMKAIQHANWDRVDFVTNGHENGGLSPVITALEAKVAAGELSTTINFHTNRSMEEDLRSMMCANGLGLARSSLADLVGFHSKAKRIYAPRECDFRYNRLALFRPEVQVYGLIWPHLGPGRYGVYKKWENTPGQRREMLEYDRISGFNQCRGGEPFVDHPWISGLLLSWIFFFMVVVIRRKVFFRKRPDSTQRGQLEKVQELQQLTATDVQ